MVSHIACIGSSIVLTPIKLFTLILLTSSFIVLMRSYNSEYVLVVLSAVVYRFLIMPPSNNPLYLLCIKAKAFLAGWRANASSLGFFCR